MLKNQNLISGFSRVCLMEAGRFYRLADSTIFRVNRRIKGLVQFAQQALGPNRPADLTVR
jgi:hypothetical protein